MSAKQRSLTIRHKWLLIQWLPYNAGVKTMSSMKKRSRCLKIVGNASSQQRHEKLFLVRYLQGQHIMVFLLETSPGPLNEALGVNSLEGREKEHPELKKLRSPW